MTDVFLSYRRETGTEYCSSLKRSLEEDGYRVYFDMKSLRQGDFEEQIENAIKECTFFLVILAGKDLDRCFTNTEKDWIVHEIGLAHKCGKIVVPVCVKEGFAFPDECDKIPELDYLSKQQMCDVSGSNFAELIKTRLYDYMNDTPAKKLKEEYQRGIKQNDYLEWEIESLKSIYYDLDFVNECNHSFPSIVFEGSPDIKYPFNELNDKENLENIGEPIDFSRLPYYDEFKKIVGPNIHFPDLYGFTNVGLILDENERVKGFKAKPRTYKETVYTGLILHYELWKAYEKTKGERLATLDDLPIRKAIHEGKTNKEVVISGCARSSLSDICLAVLAYDEDEEDYSIVVATRSSNVACYPGYLSIVPSGGFELYELENNQTQYVIDKNFSIVAAVYREYIEEVFGNTEFDQPTGNDDLNRLRKNNHIKELKRNLNKSFFFEFLGVSFDMLSLRPTFSFVLKIDDEDFLLNNDIKKNEENDDIRSIPVCDFDEVVSQNFEKSPLMCESAGVYTLLKKNHLYDDAVKGQFSVEGLEVV